MARDADTSDGKLSKMVDTAISPPSSAAVNGRSKGLKKTPPPAETGDELESAGLKVEAGGVDDHQDPAGDSAGGELEIDSPPAKQPKSQLRFAAVALAVVVALTALSGWLGFVSHQAHQDQHQRELFLQVGRQGALNLTTIDWEHADADVQRILDSATGAFYDDFSKRFQPFIDVLKRAKSKSAGTVTEAGLEAKSEDEAQVLVAVRIDTSNLSAAEQEPRHWRMRISVVKVGDELKVSNVAFVP